MTFKDLKNQTQEFGLDMVAQLYGKINDAMGQQPGSQSRNEFLAASPLDFGERVRFRFELNKLVKSL